MPYINNKIDDNRNYLEVKEYTLFIDNEDGSTTIMNNDLAFCDRLWIDSEFPLAVGSTYIYDITISGGESWEAKILEKGKDLFGDYIIVFIPNLLSDDGGYQHLSLPLDQISISIALSPDMIKGADKLIEEFNNSWPSFHESELLIIQRMKQEMHLRFSGGFLGYIAVDLFATGIISEEYDDSLEYFTKQWLTSVKLRMRNKEFEISLYNDYSISSLPDDFDFSEFVKPDFDISYFQRIEEFKNHGFIKCKNLEMVVTVDEDIKHEIEELHRINLYEMNCRKED